MTRKAKPRKPPRAKYDAAWKGALTLFFPQFVLFFFPSLYTQIDWHKPIEFLDGELRHKDGPRLVDRLVKVHLNDGSAAMLLIHIEVQAAGQIVFGGRLAYYYVLLTHQYKLPVMTIAVLIDNEPDWRPAEYIEASQGTELRFRFNTIKLLDWVGREAELQANPNAFAVVIEAQLAAARTSKDSAARLIDRLAIVRGMEARGYNLEETEGLLQFMEMAMRLPIDLEQQFYAGVAKMRKEVSGFPKMSLFRQFAIREGKLEGNREGKREGKLEGKREGKLEGKRELLKTQLKLKMGMWSTHAEAQLSQLTSEGLDALAPLVFTVQTLDELEQILTSYPPEMKQPAVTVMEPIDY